MNGYNKALCEYQWPCLFANLCAIVVALHSNVDITKDLPSNTTPQLVVSALDSRTLGVHIFFRANGLQHVSDV